MEEDKIRKIIIFIISLFLVFIDIGLLFAFFDLLFLIFLIVINLVVIAWFANKISKSSLEEVINKTLILLLFTFLFTAIPLLILKNNNIPAYYFFYLLLLEIFSGASLLFLVFIALRNFFKKS